MLTQESHHKALTIRKCLLCKHTAAYACLPCLLQFLGMLPSHDVDDVLRRGYQLGLVVAYEVVAALAVFRIDRTGNGKHLAPVVQGYAGSNQSAAVRCALNDYGGIADAGNDAVALQEVARLRTSAAWILGYYGAAVVYHLACFFLVQRRVQRVMPVCHHAYGRKSMLQCGTVCCYVNAVCQTAVYGYTRA